MKCAGEPASGEVIVVLGAAVWTGGVASPALQRRVDHGVAELNRRRADALLMTGGIGRFPPSEARVMSALARRLGIAPERIVLEERATTTRESARYCAPIIREGKFACVTLVTDDYHARRSRLAFRMEGIDADVSVPAASSQRPSLERRLSRQAREWLGIVWYWLSR